MTCIYDFFFLVGGDGKQFSRGYFLCIDLFAPNAGPRSQTGSRHQMWRYFNLCMST